MNRPATESAIISKLPTAVVIFLLLVILTGSAHGMAALDAVARVLDADTESPIVGATVRLSATTGRIADADGYFLIASSPRLTPLTISAVGYVSLDTSVHINTGDTLLFRLSRTALEGDVVSVTASRFAETVFQSVLATEVTSDVEVSERVAAVTADVLREEPGIQVQQTTAAHGTPIIRGLIGRYVLLLYDGIRLNRPTFRFGGNQYLSTVEPEFISSIDVVRGPASVLYGSDALGGTVNLVPSLLLPATRPTLDVSLVNRLRSADRGVGGFAEMTYRGRQAAVQIGIGGQQTGDLRAAEPTGVQSPTGWSEGSLSARAALFVSPELTFTGDLLAVRQDRVPRYDRIIDGSFEEFTYDPQDRDLIALTAELREPSSWLSGVRATVAYQSEREGRRRLRTGQTIGDESRDETTTWGGFVQLDVPIHDRHRLIVGGEYYDDRLDAESFRLDSNRTPRATTIPNGAEQQALGLFLNDRWTVTSRLSFDLGIRFSRYRIVATLDSTFGRFDDAFTAITGSIRARWHLDHSHNLIAGISQGFRAPNWNDALVLDFSSSGFDVPSPGIAEERSVSYEVGWRHRTSSRRASLFVYYTRLSDLIDRRPATLNGLPFLDENGNGVRDLGEVAVFAKRNVGSGEIWGVEFDGQVALAPHLTIAGNVTYTYGRNITASEPLSRIPPLMGLARVRYSLSSDTWLELFTRAAADQTRLSARDVEDSRIPTGGTPGWITWNLRGRLSRDAWAVTVTLENLTDASVREHGSGVLSSGRGVALTTSFHL